MFSRNFLVLASLLLFALVLVGREWLIHIEISSSQEALRNQLNQEIHSATTAERLRHLSSASISYERYLEPVIMDANRLISPFSRTEIISKWKREVHTQIDDLTHARSENLNAQLKRELQTMMNDSAPSLNRLYTILEKRETLMGEAESCKTTVQDEMRLMKEASVKRDQDFMAQIKVEGVAKLNLLRKNVRKMNKKEVGEFLASGKFVHEIQQPVLELIIQIRDSEIRAGAWNQFRVKLDEILGRKNNQLAKAEKTNADRLQKLFDPIAEVTREERNLNSQLVKPPELLNEDIQRSIEPVPENPASADDSPSNILE